MIVYMPSPLGRVPPKGAGEVCPQGTVAPPGATLIRHGLRRATFPRGEGFDTLNNHLPWQFCHIGYGVGEGFAGSHTGRAGAGEQSAAEIGFTGGCI